MKWFSINRSDLPAILEGRMPSLESISNAPSAEISVGLFMDEDQLILTMIVIGDERFSDLLAWLSTFAPELFPLSQSVRVLSESDYSEVEKSLSLGRPHRRDIIWPSVIIGEMLAQGEPAPNLQILPLSRASASFSFCQGRTSLIYPYNAHLQKVTTSRLYQLQRDRSFTRRLVNVEEMSAIWSFVGEVSTCTPFQSEWIRSIVGIVEAGLESSYNSLKLLERIGINARKLAGGTIEGRVLEFEKAIGLILNVVATDPEVRSNIPLIVASLCFLVGGGTSHITLLDEFASDFPMVYAWFGLLAGLAGPSAWDSQWARISTSIERLLRSGFSIFDPPSADICWAEYEWIASQSQSLPWLKELPKLYPRLVSVEVVPGASCQLRLGDSEELERSVQEARPVTHRITVVESPKSQLSEEKIVSIEAMLIDALRELKTLRNEDVHEPTQNDFFPGSKLAEPSKIKPVRKRSTKR